MFGTGDVLDCFCPSLLVMITVKDFGEIVDKQKCVKQGQLPTGTIIRALYPLHSTCGIGPIRPSSTLSHYSSSRRDLLQMSLHF